jgi:hypothetical protein
MASEEGVVNASLACAVLVRPAYRGDYTGGEKRGQYRNDRTREVLCFVRIFKSIWREIDAVIHFIEPQRTSNGGKVQTPCEITD